jgi:hypothetical protein
VEGAFKKDASGNTLFFPWGVLGSGFVIGSEDARLRIRAFYVRMMMVILPAIFIIQVFVGFWLNLVMLPIFTVWYQYNVKRMTKTFSKSRERMSIVDSVGNSARAHNLPTLILLELFSVGMVAAGGWLLMSEQTRLIALASIALFGLCGIAIGFMILVRCRDKRT